jgi:hypothetical protein
VGRDPEVAHAGVGGQDEVQERRLAAGAPALLEHVGDGRGADRTPAEGLGEGRVQGGRADLIQQAQQARGFAGEGVSPDREGLEEGLGLRAGLPEAIATAEFVRAALLGLRSAHLRGHFE